IVLSSYSLHDALPILHRPLYSMERIMACACSALICSKSVRGSCLGMTAKGPAQRFACSSSQSSTSNDFWRDSSTMGSRRAARSRSDEHTSELQSPYDL